MWSYVKVKPSKAPLTLYKHERNLPEAFVSIRAAEIVAKLKEGLGRGAPGGPPTCEASHGLGDRSFLSGGRKGKRFWEKEDSAGHHNHGGMVPRALSAWDELPTRTAGQLTKLVEEEKFS